MSGGWLVGGLDQDYTTWLNLTAIFGGSFLVYLHFRHRTHDLQEGGAGASAFP